MLPLSRIRILHLWYPNPPSCPWNPHLPSLVPKSFIPDTQILHPQYLYPPSHPWYPYPSSLVPAPFIPPLVPKSSISDTHILHPLYLHPQFPHSPSPSPKIPWRVPRHPHAPLWVPAQQQVTPGRPLAFPLREEDLQRNASAN